MKTILFTLSIIYYVSCSNDPTYEQEETLSNRIQNEKCDLADQQETLSNDMHYEKLSIGSGEHKSLGDNFGRREMTRSLAFSSDENLSSSSSEHKSLGNYFQDEDFLSSSDERKSLGDYFQDEDLLGSSDEHKSLGKYFQDEDQNDPEDEKYFETDLNDGAIDLDPIVEFNDELAKHNARDDPAISKYVDKVKFKLWNISNEEKTVLLKETTLGNENILKDVWSKNVPLKVIIHGWKYKTDESDDYIFAVKRAYLEERNKYNVMTVDWTEFAAVYNYFGAANKCAVVGIIVGQFFNNLVNLEIEEADNIHCLGHSLGAHVAGYAGRTFYDTSTNKIARITGLDPSSFGFESSNFTKKSYVSLFPNDAKFVDVIYTSLGQYLGISISNTVGHANFYPNGGHYPQPGCKFYFPLECSHARAYKYYGASISRSQSFEAVECSSFKDFKDGKCADNIRTHIGHHADTRNNIQRQNFKSRYINPNW